MRRLKIRLLVACIIASFAVAPAAWAQWAVVDAPAIVQLIQEVQTTAQQLQTAKAQLLQAKQALQTMTGDRGMEQLLGGTVRNYLPSNWTQVTGALQGREGSALCPPKCRASLTANTVLSPQRLATLSPGAQQLIQNSRQMERHATGAVASGLVERQQSLRGDSDSDCGNLFGQRIRRAFWISRPGSAPNSACCKTSKPRSRSSIRRLKHRNCRCAS